MESNEIKNCSGFTFVELLIYISILALFIGSFTMMSVNILQARTSTVAIETVVQEGQYAISRISDSIENADELKFRTLRFDGVDDYVQVPDSSSLDISGEEITISGWVNYENAPGNYWAIANKDEDETYGLSGRHDNGDLYFSVNTTNGHETSNEPWNGEHVDIKGKWSFITGVYNGSSIKLYVDTEEKYSTSHSGNIQTNTKPIYIGRRHYSDNYVLDGKIDDVRIYNRALSEEEMKNIYQGKNITEGLVGYWALNKGENEIVYDDSGNNNYGELINGPERVQANRRTGEIELTHEDESLSPIKIGLEEGRVFLQEGTKRKEYLTGEKVTVTDLEFINTTRSLEALGTIKIKMTIEYDNETGRKEMSYENTFITTVNVR